MLTIFEEPHVSGCFDSLCCFIHMDASYLDMVGHRSVTIRRLRKPYKQLKYLPTALGKSHRRAPDPCLILYTPVPVPRTKGQSGIYHMDAFVYYAFDQDSDGASIR